MATDLLRLGDETYAQHRYGEAARIYLRAFQAARGDGSEPGQVVALAQIAQSHLAQRSTGLAGPWLDRAAALARPDDAGAWLRFLAARARWERACGRQKAAQESLTEIYAFALGHNAYAQAAEAARALSAMGDLDLQQDWARTALATALLGRSGAAAGRIDPTPYWENLAWTLSLADRHREALAAFIGARACHLLADNPLVRLRADINVGRAYRLNGDLSTAAGWLREADLWLDDIHSAAPDDPTAALLRSRLRLELAEISIVRSRRSLALAQLESARMLLAAYCLAESADAAALHATVLARLADLGAPSTSD